MQICVGLLGLRELGYNHGCAVSVLCIIDVWPVCIVDVVMPVDYQRPCCPLFLFPALQYPKPEVGDG